jgi:signal transduction histidine kinase
MVLRSGDDGGTKGRWGHGSERSLGRVGKAVGVIERCAPARRLECVLSLLEATLESTADGLLVVDLSGQIVRYNAKFASLWRIPAAFLGANDDSAAVAFVDEQVVDPEAFARRIQDIYAHPEAESHDEIRLKDGRVLERYSQAQRVGGKAVGRVWSFREVTEQRRAEAERDRLLAAERTAREAAQASAERARLLAEASRILASLDHESALGSLAQLIAGSFADCCVVDVLEPNGSLRRVAVAPAGAGTDAVSCLPPESSMRVTEVGDRAFLGVPLAVAGRLLGTMRLSRARPRTFGAADLAVSEDLAGRASLAIEMARLYQRTDEALRARDEFLSLASHELRAPLATLQATTDTLLVGVHGAVAPESRLSRPLISIGRQVDRLSRLASQILDVVALSTDGIDLHLTEEDLSVIVASVVARERAGRTGVTLAAPGPVVGRWDRRRVEQLVASLVSNAVRFGAGKPVAVAVTPRDDVAVLTVQDHGLGIPWERIPRLFDRYDRAGTPASWGGLGLGLYIDRAIVRLHGGCIRVESRPGETTFFVELPLAGPPVRA